MSSIASSISYHIVRSISQMFMILPMGFVLFLGRIIGFVIYVFGSKRRRIAYQNLRIAFGATKSDYEIRLILKKTYRHFGQNIAELLRLPVFAKEGIRKRVEVVGEQHFHEALSRKKGVILLSIHSGNWELSSLLGSMAGFPYSLIANPQSRNGLIDKLLTSYRQSAGCKIINPGEGTREIIRRLKANEVITLVADQGGEDGVLVNFFGRTASMSTGAVRLAQKYGASICLVDIFRNPDGTHCIKVDPPLQFNEDSNQESIVSRLQIIINRFQEIISQHPWEYMWFYKIWKYSSSASVLILDDGRTGHLRQSQALSEVLMEELSFKEKKVEIKTVRVIFRTEFCRRIAALSAFLGRWCSFLKSSRLLRLVLSKSSYEKIMAFPADYVISCASSMGELNFLLSGVNTGKRISILRAGDSTMTNDFAIIPS